MDSLLQRKSRRANRKVKQALSYLSAGETMTSLLAAWQEMKAANAEDGFVQALIAELIVLRSAPHTQIKHNLSDEVSG